MVVSISARVVLSNEKGPMFEFSNVLGTTGWIHKICAVSVLQSMNGRLATGGALGQFAEQHHEQES